MIYFENITDAQRIYIPTDTAVLTGAVTFALRSTVDNADRLSQTVSPSDNGAEYYGLDITLPSGLSDGEYAYTLSQDGCELASGLAIIGEYVPTIQEYEKTIEYVQH